MSLAKKPLLFLCHRIPFPPNKGDKIRAWHLLKHLSRTHEIYLATFVDDPNDWEYTDKLAAICKECYFADINPRLARFRSLSGFFTGEPLSVAYYKNPKLRQWIDSVIDKHMIEDVVVYSSAMAQFIDRKVYTFNQVLIDFVDVDSDKWRQYAQQKNWPLSLIYKREARRLLEFDKRAALSADRCFFVSESEAALFKKLAPETASKTTHYYNGVDTEFFRPDPSFSNPYPKQSIPLVFTGAMDYWPNIDAVCWFAQNVFAPLRESIPDATFIIVGSNPDARVTRLKEIPGITVTGRVEDVRPFIMYAKAAVAPMRIARGIQNKVLEAMAMAKPVVVSPQGLEGIATEEVIIAEGKNDYIAALTQIIQTNENDLGVKARNFVKHTFNWENTLKGISGLMCRAQSQGFS